MSSRCGLSVKSHPTDKEHFYCRPNAGETVGQYGIQRFGYCRRRGFLAHKFNRRTKLEPCTNVQSKPFSPAFGNTLLCGVFLVIWFFVHFKLGCIYSPIHKLIVNSHSVIMTIRIKSMNYFTVGF